MNNEKWNEICFLLSNSLKVDIYESQYELNVIQALRVLGWKEFTGDIQIRPSVRIGASNRLTPDFVINSSEKKNLFVIEIKKPGLALKIDFQQQLFSYMRQLRLQYGILIGPVIQVFYDGDLTTQDDPVLLETIEFTGENEKGVKFAELFSKENFSYDSLQTFTVNSLRKINRRMDQKKLKQKVLSSEYHLQIAELIKQDFLDKYDAELIDNVLESLSIKITEKSDAIFREKVWDDKKLEKEEKANTRDKTKYIINQNGIKLPKNRFVLEFVRLYLNKKPSDYNSLKKLFRDEYQGSTGVINRLDFVETKYANKSNKRHFTGHDEILLSKDNVRFAVSTEWGKGNVDKIVDLARRNNFHVEEV